MQEQHLLFESCDSFIRFQRRRQCQFLLCGVEIRVEPRRCSFELTSPLLSTFKPDMRERPALLGNGSNVSRKLD